MSLQGWLRRGTLPRVDRARDNFLEGPRLSGPVMLLDTIQLALCLL
jgi:hypothetical protein